jgi:coenzyme F420-0:L-glutamate ligase/coenzyme F420-1:gamma-L-glutamate ligase
MIEIHPIESLPIFRRGDDLVSILLKYYSSFKDNDILVIAHTIVSRIEGKEIDLSSIQPSEFAIRFAENNNKDPRAVEVVLSESKTIVRMSESLLISETKHGFICANAGVDQSNATPNHVLTLPNDPDKTCREIQKHLFNKTGKKIGIIISDTFGGVFRKGTTNVAIGIAGFSPILSYKGKSDLFGYILKTTEVNIADELATAGGLLMGQSNEGFPIILIRGYPNITVTLDNTNISIQEIVRKKIDSLFW